MEKISRVRNAEATYLVGEEIKEEPVKVDFSISKEEESAIELLRKARKQKAQIGLTTTLIMSLLATGGAVVEGLVDKVLAALGMTRERMRAAFEEGDYIKVDNLLPADLAPQQKVNTIKTIYSSIYAGDPSTLLSDPSFKTYVESIGATVPEPTRAQVPGTGTPTPTSPMPPDPCPPGQSRVWDPAQSAWVCKPAVAAMQKSAPFKSPEQEAAMWINVPDVARKWVEKYGHATGWKEYKKRKGFKVTAGVKVVFKGLLMENEEHKKQIVEGLEKEGYGVPKILGAFKTLPGKGGEGGRSEVVLEIDDDHVGEFAVSSWHLGGDASWADDYITNNREIIPEEAMSRYFSDVEPYEEEGAEPTEEEYFNYLDDLRESGVTNMLGASPYLEKEFGLDRKKAKEIVVKWMETFGDRHRTSQLVDKVLVDVDEEELAETLDTTVEDIEKNGIDSYEDQIVEKYASVYQAQEEDYSEQQVRKLLHENMAIDVTESGVENQEDYIKYILDNAYDVDNLGDYLLDLSEEDQNRAKKYLKEYAVTLWNKYLRSGKKQAQKTNKKTAYIDVDTDTFDSIWSLDALKESLGEDAGTEIYDDLESLIKGARRVVQQVQGVQKVPGDFPSLWWEGSDGWETAEESDTSGLVEYLEELVEWGRGREAQLNEENLLTPEKSTDTGSEEGKIYVWAIQNFSPKEICDELKLDPGKVTDKVLKAHYVKSIVESFRDEYYASNVVIAQKIEIEKKHIKEDLKEFKEVEEHAEKIQKKTKELREDDEKVLKKAQLEAQMEREVPVDVAPAAPADVAAVPEEEIPVVIEDEEEPEPEEAVEKEYDRGREDQVRTNVQDLRDTVVNLAKSVYAIELSELQVQELSSKILGFLSDSISGITVERVEEIAGELLGGLTKK